MRLNGHIGALAVLTACLLLNACGSAATDPKAAVPPAAAVSMPQPNATAAQALLSSDETLESLDFPRQGTRTVQGQIKGYRSTAYAVPVSSGQTVTVTLASKINAAGFNVYDVGKAQEAVHRGEAQGLSATLHATTDTTFVIRPYLMRSVARRGTVAAYTLTVDRQ